MAILRSQADTERHLRNANALMQAEAQIDHILTHEPNFSGVWIIDSKFFPHSVRSQLEQRYRQAGWTVRLMCDQRDGDYYQMS